MEKFINIEQLSDMLQVSKSTIYHWTQAEFIPHYKLPKGIRFRAEEVLDWLKRKKVKGRETYKISAF